MPTKKKAKKRLEKENDKKSPEEILGFIIFNIEKGEEECTALQLQTNFETESQLLNRAKVVCADLSVLQMWTNLKNFELGWLLSIAKDMSANYNEFLEQLQKCNDTIGLSLSYANKLIRFYNVFKNYQPLLSTKVNFTFLLSNLKAIDQEVQKPKYSKFKTATPQLAMDTFPNTASDD